MRLTSIDLHSLDGFTVDAFELRKKGGPRMIPKK